MGQNIRVIYQSALYYQLINEKMTMNAPHLNVSVDKGKKVKH